MAGGPKTRLEAETRADVHKAAVNGSTPLAVALRQGHVAVAALLPATAAVERRCLYHV
jgi:hypothetical protein